MVAKACSAPWHYDKSAAAKVDTESANAAFHANARNFQLGHAAAVDQQPWFSNFSCEGHLAGTILVHPNGVGTPPFAIEYSQVRRYCCLSPHISLTLFNLCNLN